VPGVTFFQRIKTPFTEGPADEEARYQPRMRFIGELLQERREDLGLDLDEIGAMLRIKPTYLAALEQGRSADLPGPTYAIGFVRAYADFLGLDSGAVLARFKSEASSITARPDLSLPVPLGERSLPGGALVLVALILALCGYGIWYYLSTEERDRPARVAAVPASLQPAVSGSVLVPPPRPSDIAAAAAAQQSPPPAPAPQSPLFGAAINPAPAASTPPAAAPAASPTLPVATATPAPHPVTPPTSTPAQPASLSAATPSPAAPGIPAPRPGTPPVAASQAAAQTASAAPAAPADLAPNAARPVPAAAPLSNAAPSANAKVAIRALNDCWIQVRASDQSIVFSRVLKSGEVYSVPRTGLSLRTGNAGALEVTVDGKTVPSIGGIGALRKDVALDPLELAAGTAVHG
jgi:cytoskeleton protein RodZ